MELKYRMNISAVSEEDGGGFFIRFPELPGCSTGGETVDEAIQKAKDAVESWIEAAREMNLPIPEPKFYDNNEPSGKFTARIPKQLHKELISAAEEQGSSINQLVLYYITKGLHGEQAGTKEPVGRNEILVTERVTKVTVSDEQFKNDWENLASFDLSPNPVLLRSADRLR